MSNGNGHEHEREGPADAGGTDASNVEARTVESSNVNDQQSPAEDTDDVREDAAGTVDDAVTRRQRIDEMFDFLPGVAGGTNPAADGERLQKVLARIGVASRRECESLIAEGRVTIDGVVAVLGRRVHEDEVAIAIDGVPVTVRPDTVWYLLNKPRGVVTTADDPQGRPIVVDLVPAEPRVFSVGRLDADSEGLLLLTNDGDLTHRLTHPSYGVMKEYLVSVEGTPDRGAVRSLRDGIELEDGMTAPAEVNVIADGMVRISIHEGRNRQVRRMLAAVGHPVLRLVRTRIGPLADPTLAPGEYRRLTTPEILSLAQASGEKRPRPVAAPGLAPRVDAAASDGNRERRLAVPDNPAAWRGSRRRPTR